MVNIIAQYSKNKTTWQTIQDKICFDCAVVIPNEFMVFQDAMPIDEKLNVSNYVDRNNIKDWISIVYPSTKYESIFSKNIKCSECGKPFTGVVWYNNEIHKH